MWEETDGQATVEAALTLPVLLMCMALLVQPACVLYTRAVMHAAAAEACRLIATPPSSASVADQAYCAYVLRRLAAVPDVSVFHLGGEEGWDITLERSASGHEACVTIQTSVQPLPFLGAATPLFGQGDGSGNVVMRVEVKTTIRPDWLEGNYATWSWIWT